MEEIIENLVYKTNYDIFKKEDNIFFDISDLVILFKDFGNSIKKTRDIYSGNEKIAFQDRNIEYKSILLQDF